MIVKLTPSQFEALSQITRMTNESNSYMVAHMVLVMGFGISEAAQDLGVSYKHAHAAVTRTLHAYNLARKVCGF